MSLSVTMTANELRNLVDVAIAKADRELENKKSSGRVVQVDDILMGIAGRVKSARLARQHYAIVMGIRRNVDFDLPKRAVDWVWSYQDECDPDWLTGLAQTVYDTCAKAKLNPTIEYWSHSGIGDGFNIVIHF